MIESIEATINHIPAIVEDIRESDAWEMNSVTGMGVQESLVQCLALSPSWIAVHEDEILALYGLQEATHDGGIPWMIGCNAFHRHPLDAHRFAIKTLAGWMAGHSWLANWVHSRNKGAIHWLKRLGFDVQDPIPHGVRGELFSPFSWGHVVDVHS